MCGIAGIVEHRGDHPGSHLAAMRDTLAHRGPDGAGLECWPEEGAGLAHRRLSIIDLSDEARQPMSNESGDLWLVFNGEIYNFPALRRELEQRGHRFRSRSDSEVLLHGYEEWGEASVDRLVGMFAYALWDRRRRRLLLVRDRLGIKPLYYYADEHRLLFASEPKAILAHPQVPRRLSQPALLDYLSYGYVPGERVIFAGMHKLPAGHLLTCQDGRLERRRYWSPPEPVDGGGQEEVSAEQLRSTLGTAVRDHLLSDVPLGSFLSGGIDSSIVTVLMSRVTDGPVRTVSVGFDSGTSELPFARQVAAACGSEHHEEHATLGLAEGLIERLAEVYDEPLWDASAVPTYALCEHTRRHVKVALSGDGGDELFAGYGWYGFALRHQGHQPPGARALATAVGQLRRLPGLARCATALRYLEADPLRRHHALLGLFDPWELDRLAGPRLRAELADYDPLWRWRQCFRPDLPLLAALQRLDLETFLVDDVLVKVDRASMAHSLEVRPPFLDHRVVELALRIAPERQHRGGEGKAFLKEAFAGLLPPAILARGKRGFSPPTSAWFRSHLWQLARPRLLAGRCVADGLLDGRFIDRLVRHGSERRWLKAWSLLMLEEWYRRWQPAA